MSNLKAKGNEYSPSLLEKYGSFSPYLKAIFYE
jgi:hypothetical protein